MSRAVRNTAFFHRGQHYEYEADAADQEKQWNNRRSPYSRQAIPALHKWAIGKHDSSISCHKSKTIKNSRRGASWRGFYIFNNPASITDYRYDRVSKTVRGGTGPYFKWIDDFHTKKKLLESNSYLLSSVSKTGYSEWHAKPSREPTLIYLP